MIVYKITNNINKKVYIGQTIRPLPHRWKQHLRDSKLLDYPLYRAIKKYGPENFTVEKIDKANSIDELNKKESFYIHQFNSLVNSNGYNILSGGSNFKMPEEMKRKISTSMKGRKKNYKISSERLSKIAKENGLCLMKNKKSWAIKNGSKPFKVYKAICKQFRKRNQPSVYKKGDYVGSWLMTTECAKDLNITHQHIASCLLGNRKQHKGYIFERMKEIKNG